MAEFIIPLLFVAAGAYLLVKGADWLVIGASNLAYRVGISPLVIGMTVVALGTSAPELATSLIGGSEIAIGNVAGSNLMNIGLILGLVAIIHPLYCQGSFLRFEMPVMVAVGPAFLIVTVDNYVSRWEGLFFVILLALFIYTSIRRGRVERDPMIQEFEGSVAKELSLPKSILYVVLGFIGLTVGGEVLVDGAVDIARILGMPKRMIALTLVAGGTSLPELATCVVAARRKEGDIALGNLVGSNIFNILGIVGVVAAVRPIDVPAGSNTFDIPAVIIVQLLCVPIMLTRMKVARWEGAVLLLSYVAYMVLLFYNY